jgi:hypothetical protein
MKIGIFLKKKKKSFEFNLIDLQHLNMKILIIENIFIQTQKTFWFLNLAFYFHKNEYFKKKIFFFK